jgi:hypothetical protein
MPRVKATAKPLPERWFNDNGVIVDEHQAEFQNLASVIKDLARGLADRVTVRDLYDVMRDAAVLGVCSLVSDDAFRAAPPRQKKRKKR